MAKKHSLEIGQTAPDFKLPDTDGTIHSLRQYRGGWLLLYFYPKDFTSGCTTEACTLRDNFDELKKYATILGVSADTVESHEKFSRKYNLPFTLLADPERSVIKQYGANGVLLPKRVSFLIGPNGSIRRIYTAVRPARHADQVLHDLEVMVSRSK